MYTVFPHQFLIAAPIALFRGYWSVKNITTIPNAVPESSAAESRKLYFAHHEKCRLRMTYWKMNPTIVHGTKLTADAGGISAVPAKMTGKL